MNGATNSQSVNFIRRNIWRFFGLGISLFIALMLLQQIDVNEFADLLASFSLWSLFAAFSVYLLLNLSRALRFRLLLDQPQLPLSIIYPIALYHNFLVRTLPFKTGEVSYVVMLHHYLKQPLREGVGSLLSARLFDLVIVAAGCTLGLLTATTPLPDVQQGHLLITLLIPCLALCAAGLYFAAPILRRLVQLTVIVTGAREPAEAAQRGRVMRLFMVGQDKLQLLAAQFDRLRHPKFFFGALLLSICNYLASAAFNLILLTALGVQHDLGTMIVMISIVMFAEALPVSIAGIGIVEGGWTFGLVAFAGFDTGQAASIGFFLHACQLLSVVASGLIGYNLLQLASTGTTRRFNG